MATPAKKFVLAKKGEKPGDKDADDKRPAWLKAKDPKGKKKPVAKAKPPVKGKK